MAEKTRAQLEAEIEALKAQLGKTSGNEEENPEKKYLDEVEKHMNEEVTIKLFKGAGEYADDLVIGLNGVTVKIQRGIYVTLPRKYAELIDLANIQDIRATNAVNEAQNDYNAASKALE